MNLASARPLVLLTAPVVAATLVAVAWQGSSVGASRPQSVQDRVQTRVETRVVTQTQTQTKVVQDAAAVNALAAQLAALQETVTATVNGLAGQLSSMKQSLTAVQSSMAALQQGLTSAQATSQANNAAQAKKVSDLTTTVSGVDTRLWALQAEVDATLRKLNPGASPAPSPTH